MKKVFSLCILFVLFSTALWAQQKTITVMTYNIYHGEMAYERGKSNLEEIARVINKYRPDFVALQEVDSLTGRSAALNEGKAQELVQELAKLTGMEGFFGKAIDYDGGGYGEGILSRHPASAVNHLLPIPEGGEDRALLCLKTEVPGIGPLLFAGTHLCHQHDNNRVAQASEIIKVLSQAEEPVIMGGDFNFKPDTPPYQIITQDFLDAAAVKGNPEFTIPFDQPRSRIDYIFLSAKDQWKVLDVKVLRESASDHMPVLVKLKII